MAVKNSSSALGIVWKIENRLIKDLKPHPKNPRKLSKHDAEHLQKSLEKFGLIDKPIVTSDGLIIGGHQRLSVLKKMGEKHVECYVSDRDLSDKDVEELNIRLNRNAGEWDYDILANQWEIDELLSHGFTQEELSLDVEEISSEDPDEEDVAPPKDPKTKIGDYYDLENHRIVCGDSTHPDCVKICLGENIPILMVTDPPYGVNYDPKWRKGIKGKEVVAARATGAVLNDDNADWSLAWHLFPGSVAYVWHSALHANAVYKSLVDAEYELISNIIWAKQHFALSRGDYHWQHEPCWYAVRKGHSHNWQGARDQSTIWEISNLNSFGKSKDEDERTNHSTQKPLECMSRPMINNSSIGDGVYDPFLGSGTTLLAAEQKGRICYGIELDPGYCDIIVSRWIKYRKKIGKEYKVLKNGEECDDFNPENATK